MILTKHELEILRNNKYDCNITIDNINNEKELFDGFMSCGMCVKEIFIMSNYKEGDNYMGLGEVIVCEIKDTSKYINKKEICDKIKLFLDAHNIIALSFLVKYNNKFLDHCFIILKDNGSYYKVDGYRSRREMTIKLWNNWYNDILNLLINDQKDNILHNWNQMFDVNIILKNKVIQDGYEMQLYYLCK